MMIQSTQHQGRIKNFMQQAGQVLPTAPIMPAAAIREFRARLILEEALETITKGLGVQITIPLNTTNSSNMLNHINQVHLSACLPPNMIEAVDGCADVSVVAIGTLCALGVGDNPILMEVDTANLRKFGPGAYRRDDGKWMKPTGWTPPDIGGILEEMGWNKQKT